MARHAADGTRVEQGIARHGQSRRQLALLAIQLELHERDVLQCGSVEGRVFHLGAVQALAPEEPQVTARLTALV